MKISVISVSGKGNRLSKKIFDCLTPEHEVSRYCFHKYADNGALSFSSLSDITESLFKNSDAVIFICACGIAVRAVSPFIDSKVNDPAVLVMDDSGKFVISLLSGHLGGANTLAEIIGEKISALPVVTTATDINRSFSPDSFAKANGLIITDMQAAKEIAAAVLEGEKIGLKSDYPCVNIPKEFSEETNTRTGIYIGSDEKTDPFPITLHLVPKNIVLGIGCRRGTSCDEIESHVKDAFKKNNLRFDRICAVSTINIKSDEEGLLEVCRKYNVPLIFYSAEKLMSLSGVFNCSEFVRSKTGTDNVCERSAVLCSSGSLVMRKMCGSGVTAAAAEKEIVLDFKKKVL